MTLPLRLSTSTQKISRGRGRGKKKVSTTNFTVTQPLPWCHLILLTTPMRNTLKMRVVMQVNRPPKKLAQSPSLSKSQRGQEDNWPHSSRGGSYGRRGWGKPSPPQSSPLPNPLPSDPADSSHEEHPQVESSNASESSSKEASPVPLPKSKEVKKTSDLTQADAIADWIQENDYLHNKKVKDYKDKSKKDKLWSDKAAEMRTTSKIIKIWNRSFRTRYGRLIKRKSVRQTLTERDEWARA